jgi:protease I
LVQFLQRCGGQAQASGASETMERTMAKIAIVLGNDFEDSEFRVPYDRVRQAGHEVTVCGVRADEQVTGKRQEERIKVDAAVTDLDADDFDALVIPGGYSPDHLRTDANVVAFVQNFAKTDRPIAAVCHGPQLLIEAGLVKNRKLTSWPSVRKDLENAGAHWVDDSVVEDGSLITSRKPQDLDQYSNALLRRLEPDAVPTTERARMN